MEVKLRLSREIEDFFKKCEQMYGVKPIEVVRFALRKAKKESPELRTFTPRPTTGVKPRLFRLTDSIDAETLRRILTWYARTQKIDSTPTIRIHPGDAKWLELYPVPEGYHVST